MLTLAIVAAGVFYFTVFFPWSRGISGWERSIDLWIPEPAALRVFYGDYPGMYEGARLWASGPLYPVLIAPAIGIADLFKLTPGFPYLLPTPSMWFVYGPYGLALCIIPLLAVRAVAAASRSTFDRATAFGRETLAKPEALWKLQTWIVVLAIFPAAAIDHHVEDVVTLGLVLFAAQSTLRERHIRAAILIGLSIGFKQWGILALPTLYFWVPKGTRIKWLAWALGIPLVLYGIPLGFDWKNAYPALFQPLSSPAAIAHPALWMMHRKLVSGSELRPVAVLVAIAIGWFARNRRDSGGLLAALCLVFVVRLPLEVSVFAYYTAAPLTLRMIYQDARGSRLMPAGLLAFAVLLMYPWNLSPWLWWPLQVALLVLLFWAPFMDLLRTRVTSESTPPADELPPDTLAEALPPDPATL